MNKGVSAGLGAAVALGALRLLSGGGDPTQPPAPVTAVHAHAASGTTSSTRASGGSCYRLSSGAPLANTTAASKDTYPQTFEPREFADTLHTFLGKGPGELTPATPSNGSVEPARLAIAIVPDPAHTQLALMFDRQMAAIQQAAQDEHFEYDSSWLPWKLENKTYSNLADTQRSEDLAANRDACPGVLLFRHGTEKPQSDPAQSGAADPYRSGLIVLVVGEQPTHGVNRDQWQNAVEVAAAVQAQLGLPQRELRVLGPTLSGSLASLDHLLHQDNALPGGFQQVQALSGGVSSGAAIGAFQAQQQVKSAVPVTFGTFQDSDELQIARFLDYWHDRGVDAGEVAVLSEDETAYGEAPRPADGRAASPGGEGPLNLAYPRDLSVLRAEYQKESVFDSSSGGSDKRPHAILQQGAEPDEDPRATSDTVPAYSGHVTPLAQEAVLYGIVSELRTHHSRFVLLRCTNPLDYLFLTRFLHRAYPAGRIVLVGQDLLLRREIDTTEFRGVMALTNYPLVPRDDHWSLLAGKTDSTGGHTHRIFESSVQEGTYLAARYTFGEELATTAPVTEMGTGTTHSRSLRFKRKGAFPVYASPFWLSQDPERGGLPPMWLTVVGRDGFWPVAALAATSGPQNTGGGTDATVQLQPGGKSQDPDSLFDLPTSWTVTAMVVLLLFAYQVYGLFGIASGTVHSTGLLSIFRAGSSTPQRLLLGVGSSLVCLLVLAVACIALPMHGFSLFTPGLRTWLQLVFCLLSPCLFVLLLWPLLKSGRMRAAAVIVCVCGVCSAVVWYGLYFHDRTLPNAPLFYRFAHVTSGVSPLLPILFLLGGFYLWVWQATAGNMMLERGRPRLPAAVPMPCAGPARWRQKLVSRLDARLCTCLDMPSGSGLPFLLVRISDVMERRIIRIASPLSVPWAVWAVPLCVSVALAFAFYPYKWLLSLESIAYNRVINGLLMVVLVLTLAEAARLYFTWDEMRRVLGALSRLRLRRTFSRLRAVPSSSLWSVAAGVQFVQHSFFSAQWNAGCRLQDNLASPGSLLKPAAHPPRDPSLALACAYGAGFQEKCLRNFTGGLQWDLRLAAFPLPVGALPAGVSLTPDEVEQLTIRDLFNRATADLLCHLLVEWQAERGSLNLDLDEHCATDHAFCLKPSDKEWVRNAEEFVCYHYIAFIQNILARMRTMIVSMVSLFVGVCLAVSFYPFVPRSEVTVVMLVDLCLIAISVLYVYAGMERDEILSYITNSEPGKLGIDFWVRSVSFLAGPVAGLFATQFPIIGDSVFGWVKPALDSFRP